MISSACSIPPGKPDVTEVTPPACCSGDSWLWVVLAGWIASGSYPDIGDVVEHAQRVDEGLASFQPALVLEANQRACRRRGTRPAPAHLPVQWRRSHHPWGGWRGSRRPAAFSFWRSAQRRRLQPLNELEGVLRAEREAIVPLHGHPRLEDEGDRPQQLHRLNPDCAVVAGIGLVEQREAGTVAPVEAATVEDDATDRGAVTADVLGGRVDGDVGAVLDRLTDDPGGNIVDDQRNAQLVAICATSPMGKVQLRVRQGFAEESTGAVIAELVVLQVGQLAQRTSMPI